jgi:hypothetical protein
MITLRGAVVGAVPTVTGPRGRAIWRNESVSAMISEAMRLSLPVRKQTGLCCRGELLACSARWVGRNVVPEFCVRPEFYAKIR